MQVSASLSLDAEPAVSLKDFTDCEILGNRSNPLAWALTEDAIRNGGPGRLDRIDMRCCMHTKAHGLSVLDVMRTEALSLKCAKAILSFSPKPKHEPELPLYCAREGRAYVPGDETEIEQASHNFGVPIDPVAPVVVK
jgi:hypothetical protein